MGRAAGNIYAVGTVASVVAALATGFFLIPTMGVRRLLVLIGLLLLIAGALAMIGDRRSRRGAIAPILCLALVGFGGAQMPRMAPAVTKNALAFVESPYAELRVIERWDQRYLIIGGSQHTIVDRETMDSVAPYVVATDIIRLFDSERGRALVVGLGGGSVAKRFAASHWQVDAVEIDPDVIALAHGYFGLRDDEAQVECMDARRYLRTHSGPYKAVVLDAYGSGIIPFHLVTDEYFGLVKSRLVPDGIVAVNLQCVGWDCAHRPVRRGDASAALPQRRRAADAGAPRRVWGTSFSWSPIAISIYPRTPFPMRRTTSTTTTRTGC